MKSKLALLSTSELLNFVEVGQVSILRCHCGLFAA